MHQKLGGANERPGPGFQEYRVSSPDSFGGASRKRRANSRCKSRVVIRKLVLGRLEGFEPSTSRTTIWRYYQLSYSRREGSKFILTPLTTAAGMSAAGAAGGGSRRAAIRGRGRASVSWRSRRGRSTAICGRGAGR